MHMGSRLRKPSRWGWGWIQRAENCCKGLQIKGVGPSCTEHGSIRACLFMGLKEARRKEKNLSRLFSHSLALQRKTPKEGGCNKLHYVFYRIWESPCRYFMIRSWTNNLTSHLARRLWTEIELLPPLYLPSITVFMNIRMVPEGLGRNIYVRHKWVCKGEWDLLHVAMHMYR